MPDANQKTWLVKARSEIARTVRELRLKRAWTQAELSKRLGISQNRLSELENHQGSFTAEQLLLLAQLFNHPASEFVRIPDKGATAQLQNALVRYGAIELVETELLPSERVEELGTLVKEVLVDGAPRLVAGLAPVVLRHANRLHLPRIQSALASSGFPRRLPWVLENIVVASQLVRSDVAEDSRRLLTTAVVPLRIFVDSLRSLVDVSPVQPDVLDRTLRSERTLQEAMDGASEPSRYWKIVTALVPDDFARSLRVAFD